MQFEPVGKSAENEEEDGETEEEEGAQDRGGVPDFACDV